MSFSLASFGRLLFLGLLVLMAVLFAVTTAGAINPQGERIAVVFESRGSGRTQQVVGRALRQALGEAGYQPVFTSRSSSRIYGGYNRRTFDGLPPGITKVLVVTNIEVIGRQSGSTQIRVPGSPRLSVRISPRKETVYLAGEMVEVITEASLSFAEVEGSASDGGFSLQLGGGLNHRTRNRDNLRFKAALNAAKKLVDKLQ